MNKANPLLCAALVCFCATIGPQSAKAEDIATNRAVLRAMDKITGRFTTISAAVGSTVSFGSLEVDIQTCLTRPPEETPENTAFLDIREKKLDGSTADVFKGWMFSSSPALSAMEHPVFDIWILECRSATKAELEADRKKEVSKMSPFMDDVAEETGQQQGQNAPSTEQPAADEEIGEDEAAARAAEAEQKLESE